MKRLFQSTCGAAAAVLLFCMLLAGAFSVRAAEDPEVHNDPPVILVVLEPGRTDTPIDLFLNAYGGTVLSERSVIAPGTENAVSVRFSEPHGVPFSYKVYLKTEVLRNGAPEETELPLMVRAEGGEYRPFSDWAAGDDGLLVKQASLPAGKQGSLLFSWKWDFERGDDAGDVALSTLQDLSAIVRIIVITEAEEPVTGEPTTEAPTEESTTEAPTERPTEEPTTETPTERPTEEPTTEAPTEKPTVAPTKPPRTDAPTTEAPTKPPKKPVDPKPFGVDDSPVGIIVVLVLAAAAGVLLIILYKKNRSRNE